MDDILKIFTKLYTKHNRQDKQAINLKKNNDKKILAI